MLADVQHVMSEMGCIQVYTGKGKGKTTASLGLALRAVGHNKKVAIVQFFKSGDTGELFSVVKYIPNIKIHQFGKEAILDKQRRIFDYGRKINEKIDNKFRFYPYDEEKEAVRRAFDYVKKLIKDNEYDIIVLDEMTYALNNGLIGVGEFLEILKKRSDEVEIIITGRDAPEKLIEKADLVTEMKEIKHYFNDGLGARPGIEY